MKVVILAGGLGTRIAEESHLKPKPMIEIGEKPILWHVMKIYAQYGYNDFIVCLGYKGHMIKEYFLNYYMNECDLQVDLETNKVEIKGNCNEKFKVTLVDTGLNTMTAGRINRIKEYVGDEEFMLTYGDGVANVDIDALVKFHKEQGKIATCTAIQPDGRFGALGINEKHVITSFKEKPKGDEGWINGGFFVCKPEIFNYFKEDADDVMLEQQPMLDLSSDEELVAYPHRGFWKAMDSMRDKDDLEKLWKNNPLWKIW